MHSVQGAITIHDKAAKFLTVSIIVIQYIFILFHWEKEFEIRWLMHQGRKHPIQEENHCLINWRLSDIPTTV